ncbi:ATP-binding protein [Leptospira ryugenii]|uniref:ATP-binding protein n=1 Tax=Leptospira ryugenii TaxID=1917863 RepID=UPI000D59FDEE|nr:ATP-binding protein [Leptospira ryugenii]
MSPTFALHQIFETLLQRLGKAIALRFFQTERIVISYSGGKDSTLCLAFFSYLQTEYKLPEPHVFHLNHQIRNNEAQEQAIESFLKANFTNVTVKKKIFPN